MARLTSIGWELGSIIQEKSGDDGNVTGVSILSGAPTLDTSIKRSGRASLKCDGVTGGATSQQVRLPRAGGTSGDALYTQFWIYVEAYPDAATTCTIYQKPSQYSVRLASDGRIGLWTATGSIQIGSWSAAGAVALDTWHCIRVFQQVTTTGGADDSAELQLDGNVIASETNVNRFTAVSGNNDFGISSAPDGAIIYYDDIIINSNAGSDENSWPDPDEQLVFARPAYDVAVGAAWKSPQTSGDDTTDLYLSQGWPADGVAHSDVDANNLKYAYHDVASQTNLAIGLESYDDLGVPTGSDIKTITGLARIGSSSTTNTAGAISVIENPDQVTETAFTTFDQGVVAGTEPTGWWTVKSITQYNPTVVLTDPLEIRVGKRVNNARVAMVAAMGVYIGYVEPAADTTPPTPNIVVGPDVTRISDETGKDQVTFEWESDEDFQSYQIRSVPTAGSDHTTGSLIEENVTPASGGTAGTNYSATITDDEITAVDPGDEIKIIKVFVRDIAGNWST